MQVRAQQAVVSPRSFAFRRSLTTDFALALAASAFVAVCAHVSLPLLFTPVPLTLGNFAVILVGLVLGPRIGFATLTLYLMEGASGLPVFNPGGMGGFAQLLGPTGGYLMAYPVAAAIAGFLSRGLARKVNSFVAACVATLLATAFLLTTGILWLSHMAHLSLQASLSAGLLPFVPGELIKILIASGIYQTLARDHRIAR